METMKALIIVDVQNDFINGSLATDPKNTLAPKISRYVESMDKAGYYDVLITTQDWHIEPQGHWVAEGEQPDYVNTWPIHCRAGSFGSEIEKELDLTLSDLPVQNFYKGQYDASYSGFDGTNNDGVSLYEYLRSRFVDEVDIVGIATDFCVKATAIDAQKLGFHTTVLRNLVVGVDENESTKLLDYGFKKHNIEVFGEVE